MYRLDDTVLEIINFRVKIMHNYLFLITFLYFSSIIGSVRKLLFVQYIDSKDMFFVLANLWKFE